MARACDRIYRRLRPDGGLKWNRYTIGRLERVGNKNTTARQLRRDELEVLAIVIRDTRESLVGLEAPGSFSVFDLHNREDDAAAVRARLAEFMSKAKEIHGWCTWLPASLELPEFMRARHAAVYSRNEVRRWNRVGDQVRQALHAPQRKYRLFHYTFLSDLKAIAEGSGIYKNFPVSLRRRQLDYLLSVTAPPLDVRIVVADEAHSPIARAVALDLRSYDTVLVIDRKVVMRRNRIGITEISERDSRVLYWQGVLNELASIDATTDSQLRALLGSLRDACA